MFYSGLIGSRWLIHPLFFAVMALGCLYPSVHSLSAQRLDNASGDSIWTLDEITRERGLLRARPPQEVVEQCTTLIENKTLSTVGLAQMYHERGVARFAMGDYDEALRDFDQALLLNPSFAYALVEKARVYVARGEFSRAAGMLDAAGPLKNDPLVMGSRALIFIKSAHYDEALPLLNEALKNNPEEARLYILRAMVYYAQKQTGAGDNDMAQARRLNPEWVQAYNQALRESKEDRPVKPAAEAVMVPMTPNEALESITQLYGEGKYAAACREADGILEREPELLRIRFYRARSLLAQGKQAAAIPDLTWLIDQAGPREDLCLLRAHAHYASNRYAEALADYRRVLDINPQSDEAAQWIRRIQEEAGLP